MPTLNQLQISQYIRPEMLSAEKKHVFTVAEAKIEPNGFKNMQLTLTFAERVPGTDGKNFKWSVSAKSDVDKLIAAARKHLNLGEHDDIDDSQYPNFGLTNFEIELVQVREVDKKTTDGFVMRSRIGTISTPSASKPRIDTAQIAKMIDVMEQDLAAIEANPDNVVDVKRWHARYATLSGIAKSLTLTIPAEISTITPKNTHAVAIMILAELETRVAEQEADNVPF